MGCSFCCKSFELFWIGHEMIVGSRITCTGKFPVGDFRSVNLILLFLYVKNQEFTLTISNILYSDKGVGVSIYVLGCASAYANIKNLDLPRLNAVSRVGHIRKPRVTQQMEDSLPVLKLLLLYLHLPSYVQRHSSGKNITKETMSHVSYIKLILYHLKNSVIFK